MGRSRYGVRDEIKDTAEAFYRAVSARNLKAIDALWAHEPYAAVAGMTGHIHQGWGQVSQYWRSRFGEYDGMKVSSKLSKLVCHAVGDVGWLSGMERRAITNGEETWTEDLRVTCVLERRGTTWQIVSYHASAPAEHKDLLAPAS